MTKMSLNNNYLKLLPHFPGANELTYPPASPNAT